MVVEGPDDDQILVFGGLKKHRYSNKYSSEDYCGDLYSLKVAL